LQPDQDLEGEEAFRRLEEVAFHRLDLRLELVVVLRHPEVDLQLVVMHRQEVELVRL
jgi:hypothetical protein